jgi:hypothetical protein
MCSSQISSRVRGAAIRIAYRRRGYNRDVKKATCAAAFLVLVACGGRDIQNKEAVRQGVIEYLTARAPQMTLDLSTMQIDVVALTFGANEAHATMSFRPKGTTEGGMQIAYDLDRKGNKWVVRPRTEGTNPHGAGAPPAQPAPGLPPGHPPVGSR